MADNMNRMPDNVHALLAEIVDRFRLLLRENLVGIYLHGSLAMGGFNPQTSDIDFVVVVNEKLGIEAKRAVIAFVLNLAKDAPPKGLEFSVVVLDATQHFIYPTPFELHYSPDWHNVYMSGQADYETQRYDADLAAHFMIIRQRGICLYGKPIEDVFGDVPEADYWDSIRGDAADILNSITQNPVYGVLNLCRVLAFKQERLIVSKVEGGHWGLERLDTQFHALIQHALNAYEASDSTVSDWDNEGLQRFAEYMKPLL